MDEKDEAIIRVLERRADLSRRALSEALDMPVSTVHRRIKRLEQEGVIAGYRAIVNYEKTGRPISALILINLAEAGDGIKRISKKDVLDSLRKQEEVEEIIEVQAAGFDLAAKARFENLRELSEFIDRVRAIEGNEEVSTAIITGEIFPYSES